jgi:leucyl aminopeptidase
MESRTLREFYRMKDDQCGGSAVYFSIYLLLIFYLTINIIIIIIIYVFVCW